MGGGPASAGAFVVEFVGGLYLLAVLLRFIFQLVRADFYNPISQFVVTVTNPPLAMLRRLIPGLWGIDLAALVLLLAVALIKFYLLFMVVRGGFPAAPGAVVYAVGDILDHLVYVYMGAIIIRAILSWVAPRGYNPIITLLITVTEPVMAPARRVLPPIGGLDLSPILVFLVLGVVARLLVDPILTTGEIMALR